MEKKVIKPKPTPKPIQKSFGSKKQPPEVKIGEHNFFGSISTKRDRKKFINGFTYGVLTCLFIAIIIFKLLN
jgi:hypothetical protein